MGIPRLLQDLLPYAERVVLGTAPEGTIEAIAIKNLVIDGPSLVYFVYNKLLSYHTSTTLPPTYDEINRGVHHLLGHIQSHGVSIRHIFFDGGLPKSKREIRLGRMEKVRQQLEIFRKVHSAFPPIGPSSVEVIDFENVLWGTSAMSTRKLNLPTPPFMVASAIETLRTPTSAWRDRVHVVAGEADMYCALAARDSAETVAILTNDTDLAVHDLGPNGRVALLHSIERVPQQSSRHRLSLLIVSSISPQSVASRLNVSSLLAFGFERSLDSTVSTTVIRERAAATSKSEQLRMEYTTFCEEFLPPSTPSADTQLELDDIDPRTAELLVTFKDAPHVYLTPVLEDPQRDSSWSYGAGIRRLSFSILQSSAISRRGEDGDYAAALTEYARKGQRISPTTVSSFKRAEIFSQAAHLERLFVTLLPPADQSPLSIKATVLAAWYTLAIYIVYRERVRLHKASPSTDQVFRLFGFLQTTDSALKEYARVSWDDIHLLANIHAVLYSLRMLYQTTDHVLKRAMRSGEFAAVSNSDSDHDKGPSKIKKSLHKTLSGMPPIADLFLDIPHLRAKLGEISVETRSAMIFRLKGELEPDVECTSVSANLVVDKEEFSNSGLKHRNGELDSMKPKNRRKRERHTERTIAPSRSKNMFGVLSEDAG